MRSQSLVAGKDVHVKTLGRDPGEVPAARRFVRRVLAGRPAAGDAELLACELVTNAVMHADGGGQVRLEVAAGGEGVHVEVADDGTAGVPAWREPAAGAESGRDSSWLTRSPPAGDSCAIRLGPAAGLASMTVKPCDVACLPQPGGRRGP